jgi:hypothetical protein
MIVSAPLEYEGIERRQHARIPIKGDLLNILKIIFEL